MPWAPSISRMCSRAFVGSRRDRQESTGAAPEKGNCRADPSAHGWYVGSRRLDARSASRSVRITASVGWCSTTP